MPSLTLYADSSWMNPWVFHAMVALEEKQLPYKLETLKTPLATEQKAELHAHGATGSVPCLVHHQDDGSSLWIGESLAISEYLAERFPTPGNPRIFPADLGQRARARQLVIMLRAGTVALRDERPMSSVFGRPLAKPLGERAQQEVAELVTIVGAIMKPGAPSLFGDWCIADADVSLALMRLVANRDPLPQALVDYALRQWDRASVKKYATFLPTTH